MVVLKYNSQAKDNQMRLQDINTTVFQSLSPEVQSQLIASGDSDSLFILALIAMMFIPMLLMR